MFLVPAMFAGCQRHNVDNSYSHSNFQLELSANDKVIILDEDNPDEVALHVQWTPAKDYGDDFLMTYTYSMEVTTSTAPAITEYEDDENFVRDYTNAELHDMLVGHFGQKTSSYCEILVKATASYAGPYVVIPDESAIRIKVKTYGQKQFGADKVTIGGSAIDGDPILVNPSENNPNIYIYTGDLKAGKFYFPVVYGDENNAIIPEGNVDTPVSSDAMPAGVVDAAKVAGGWVVSEPNEYRVTLNMSNRTVTIIKTEDIFDFDKIFMGGTAVGEEYVELEQALENSSLYAYFGELKAGTFYLPVEFEEATNLAILPKSQSHDIEDGVAMAFAQGRLSQSANYYWSIPQTANYRVVLDVTAMTLTIYSPATAKPNTKVSYNNTVLGINPYEQEVTELWMYGGFNSYAKDADLAVGFQRKWCLKQSAADPNVFCYYGAPIQRNSYKGQTGSTASQTFDAYFNLKVSSINNNVYAYGSTADAKRNDHDGFTEMKLGVPAPMKAGQSDNRYAWFFIPEGANYIMANIETLEIVIDQR